jgi:Spy/CpxP family protein refolding chaperone
VCVVSQRPAASGPWPHAWHGMAWHGMAHNDEHCHRSHKTDKEHTLAEETRERIKEEGTPRQILHLPQSQAFTYFVETKARI